MTTTRQLLDRVRREFLGSRTEPLNRLAADPTTTTTMAFTYDLKGIVEGARLSVELEDVLVWSADPTSKTAVVERGFESSTALAHPIGTVVRVSPRVSDKQILDAVNNELRSLYGLGVFRMDTEEMTFTSNTSAYQLPSGALDVYRVHGRNPSEPGRWDRLYGWQVDRHQNTTDFATGQAINFYTDMPEAGFPFRITYRRELGILSTLIENVETTTGTSAIDLLVLGAGIRLIRGRETARNLSDAQGSTRRANEVPAGAEIGSIRALRAAYTDELARERGRLVMLYPMESMR